MGTFSRLHKKSVVLYFFELVQDEASVLTVFLHLDLQILINSFLSRFCYFLTAAEGRKEQQQKSFVYISRNGICHLRKGIFAVLIMNVYFIHTSSKLSSYTIWSGGILFHTFRCLKAVWKCISYFLIWEHFNRRGFNLFWNFNSCSAQKLKLESIKMHFSAVSILIFLFSVTVQFT